MCVTYGFTIGPQNRSFKGLAQFCDAQLLFFPVHSARGPIWVTSPSALASAGYDLPAAQRPAQDRMRVCNELMPAKDAANQRLNMGWLSLEIETEALDVEKLTAALGLAAGLAEITKRLALVSDQFYGTVVNSNLEVRTSVSIDPATGAAEDRALFTYEALPRGTVLAFQVIYPDPKYFVFPEWNAEARHVQPAQLQVTRDDIAGYVRQGLEMMEYLGVGGMNTRGFGRLRVLYPKMEGE